MSRASYFVIIETEEARDLPTSHHLASLLACLSNPPAKIYCGLWIPPQRTRHFPNIFSDDPLGLLETQNEQNDKTKPNLKLES